MADIGSELVTKFYKTNLFIFIFYKVPCLLLNQWPNLKNLSGGLNLSRGLYMVYST